MRDAFGRTFFGLDSKVLRVGFITCFVAKLLGLDSVCFSAVSYCGGGGISKNCVSRDAIGEYDGCQGVVLSFGECEHALSQLRTVETARR